MSRRRVLLVAGVGAAAALGGAGWGLWRSSRVPAVDTAALWSMRFATPDGGELAMAQLEGRPLLINFWATWCAPCVREMPELDRFHREVAPHGLQVLGLAIDRADAVREFLRRIPVGFPIAVAGLEGAELLRALGNAAAGLPFTLLLDADGKVRRQRLGETTHAELVGWSKVVLNRD